METKQMFIGEYINKNPRQRIAQLLDNYGDFRRYREHYKRNVVELMEAIREYNIRPSEEDLGVRVQTTGGTSNITASKAIERMALEECFENRKISKEMFEDPEELRLISTAVYEWDLMTREFKVLNTFVKQIKPKDRSIYLFYLKGEKGFEDIAKDLDIEYESARKRVYRIRKALIKEALPWFDEYKISVPA